MAQIEEIFSIYDERFYRYLRPFVVDDLRNKDMTYDILSKATELDSQTKNYIKKSVHDYFIYMFPRATFPPIKAGLKQKLAEADEESQRDIVWKQVQRYLSEHNWWLEIFDALMQTTRGKDLIDYVTNEEFDYNYMKQVDELKEEILLRPLIDIINELKGKYKGKKPLTQIQFLKLPKVSKLNLPLALLNESYKKLRIQLEQNAKEIERDNAKLEPEAKQPRIRAPRPKNAKEYIKYNIIPLEKHEVVKSLEELFDLVFDKMGKNETREQLYQYYLEQRNQYFKRTSFKIPNYNPKVPIEKYNYNYKELTKLKDDPNYFPLKQNLKKYSLHSVAPRYSYIIDLMFENRKYCYLVAININTRKLWVEPTNVKINVTNADEDDEKIEYRIIDQMKSSTLFIDALQQMIAKGMKIKYLKGDGEKAFDSDTAKRFYEDKGIEWTPVKMRQQTQYPDYMNELNMVKKLKNKTEPNHTSLGLIDRVIRTIRDIAYNLKEGVITPPIMQFIVHCYNNTPHITLSKYAGYKVTPNDVDNNEELERFIVRKIQQENYDTTSHPGFDIPINEEVVVYNVPTSMAKRRTVIEPGNWIINQRLGNIYEIVDADNNNKKLVSRYKIHPKIMPYKL